MGNPGQGAYAQPAGRVAAGGGGYGPIGSYNPNQNPNAFQQWQQRYGQVPAPPDNTPVGLSGWGTPISQYNQYYYGGPGAQSGFGGWQPTGDLVGDPSFVAPQIDPNQPYAVRGQWQTTAGGPMAPPTGMPDWSANRGMDPNKYVRVGNTWQLGAGNQAMQDQYRARRAAYEAQGGGYWEGGTWHPGPRPVETTPPGSTTPDTTPQPVGNGPGEGGGRFDPIVDHTTGQVYQPGTNEWTRAWYNQTHPLAQQQAEAAKYQDWTNQPGGEAYSSAFKLANQGISGQAQFLGDPRYADWQAGPGGQSLIRRMSKTPSGLAFLQSRGIGNLAP